MTSYKKIQLELYANKAEGFYLSLIKYKLSGKTDPKDLQAMADAIHLDKDFMENSMVLPEAEQKKINDKLLEIHSFLLKSRKDSEHYFTVSKGSFDEFMASPFGTELQNMFFIAELIRKWKGKENSAEVKGSLAVVSWFIRGLVEGLGEAVEKFLTKSINAAFSIEEGTGKPFTVKPNKKGNLVYESEDKKIETELYVEKGGDFVRKEVKSVGDMNIEVSSFFMKSDHTAVHVKETVGSIEIIRYDKVSVKNKKLDLTESTVIETVSIPKEDTGEQSITVKRTEPIVYNYEEMLGKPKQDTVKQPEQTIEAASVFETLEKNFSEYLTLPANNPRKNEVRDKLVIGIYEMLLKHYGGHTTHFYSTITGYVASRMSLLDTEQEHDETNRIQPYRKYLRDTVYNILKAGGFIQSF